MDAHLFFHPLLVYPGTERRELPVRCCAGSGEGRRFAEVLVPFTHVHLRGYKIEERDLVRSGGRLPASACKNVPLLWLFSRLWLPVSCHAQVSNCTVVCVYGSDTQKWWHIIPYTITTQHVSLRDISNTEWHMVLTWENMNKKHSSYYL